MVAEADGEITASADTDHAFVLNNYLVQGNRGTAWAYNTALLRYLLILMQIQRTNGTFSCI